MLRGKPLLRLLKDGVWVFGHSQLAPSDPSLWVIDIRSIEHGWCCWANGVLLGQCMASISQPKPMQPPPIGNTAYTEQCSCELKCVDGLHVGSEVLYKTSSVGGMHVFEYLVMQIQRQLDEDPTRPCPVVRLDVDAYDHFRFGRVYTPVMTVVSWSDMEGAKAASRPPVRSVR